jgi:hypothetical protein
LDLENRDRRTLSGGGSFDIGGRMALCRTNGDGGWWRSGGRGGSFDLGGRTTLWRTNGGGSFDLGG